MTIILVIMVTIMEVIVIPKYNPVMATPHILQQKMMKLNTCAFS